MGLAGLGFCGLCFGGLMGGRLGSALLGISRVRFRNPPTHTEIAEMQRGGPPATADDGIRRRRLLAA